MDLKGLGEKQLRRLKSELYQAGYRWEHATQPMCGDSMLFWEDQNPYRSDIHAVERRLKFVAEQNSHAVKRGILDRVRCDG